MRETQYREYADDKLQIPRISLSNKEPKTANETAGYQTDQCTRTDDKEKGNGNRYPFPYFTGQNSMSGYPDVPQTEWQ